MQDKMKKILDGLETNIYMTDAVTHKILFMNERMKKEYNIHNPEGKICWEVRQKGQNGVCEFCKVKELIEENKGRIRWEEKIGSRDVFLRITIVCLKLITSLFICSSHLI